MASAPSRRDLSPTSPDLARSNDHEQPLTEMEAAVLEREAELRAQRARRQPRPPTDARPVPPPGREGLSRWFTADAQLVVLDLEMNVLAGDASDPLLNPHRVALLAEGLTLPALEPPKVASPIDRLIGTSPQP